MQSSRSSMQTNKIEQAAFAAFYLFMFAGISCMSAYFNVFLETCRGFGGTQLGLFNALSSLATVFVLPFLGSITSRTGGYWRTLVLFCFVVVVAVAAMQWQTAIAGLLVLGCLNSMSKSCALSTADTTITAHLRAEGGNYGAVRSFGSIGYALGGIVLGLLAVRFTLEKTLIPVSVCCYALAFAGALFFPRKGINGDEAEGKTANPLSESPSSTKSFSTADALAELAKNRRYRFLIFITLFSAYTLDCNGNYIGNHLVVTLGAPESMISLNTACCVIPEILFLPIVSRIVLPRFGYKALYRFSSVILVLRCLFYIAVDDPRLFILGSLLHCIAIGCNPVAGLAFAADVARPQIYGTAVAIYTLSQSVAAAVYGYACGWIYEIWGSRAIFVMLLVINLISAAVIFHSKLFEGVGTVSAEEAGN